MSHYRYYSLLLILLLSARAAPGQELARGDVPDRGAAVLPASAHGREHPGKWRISLSTGFQQEDLRWSIAGNRYGQSPNIYSELKWRALAGPSVHVALRGELWKKVFLFAEGGRVFFLSGRVDDTDYQGDDRSNASYREQFSAVNSSSSSWSAGAGYQVLRAKKIALTPYLGYGIQDQSLVLRDPGGPGLLNSNYKTRWSGPLFRVSAALQLGEGLQLEADLRYLQINYSARADWNLITAFSHPVSFRHAARGYGLDTYAGLAFRRHAFGVSVGAGYFSWQTGAGTDMLYLAAGTTNTTRLNEVIRDGFRGLAGIHIFL